MRRPDPLTDPGALGAFLDAARSTSIDALRALGALVLRDHLGATSGAALGELCGVTERSGRRTLQQLQDVERDAWRRLADVPRPPDPDAVRPLTGNLAPGRPADGGGMGGHRAVGHPPLPSDSDSDAEAAYGGGCTGEGAQADDGRSAANPPRHANASAAAFLQALGLSPDDLREAMAHLRDRWRRHHRAVRDATAWCLTVVRSWCLKHQLATGAQLTAAASYVASLGTRGAGSADRSSSWRGTAKTQDQLRAEMRSALAGVEAPPPRCTRCGHRVQDQDDPQPGACANPACTWRWHHPGR